MKNFAERLKEIQRQKGMTQREMADFLELSPTTMSAYMRDAKTPALDVAYAIAQKLNVPIGWLCGESESTGKLVTYADLIRTLVKIHDFTPIEWDDAIGKASRSEISENGAKKKAKVEFDDSAIVDFFADWERIHNLLCDGTIDAEMYDAWMEKRLRSYEEMPLHFDSV